MVAPWDRTKLAPEVLPGPLGEEREAPRSPKHSADLTAGRPVGRVQSQCPARVVDRGPACKYGAARAIGSLSRPLDPA